MSTATLPAPVVPDVDDADVDHYSCCDPNVAMCGLELPDDEYEEVEHSPSEVCPLCRLVYESGWPCPIPGCGR